MSECPICGLEVPEYNKYQVKRRFFIGKRRAVEVIGEIRETEHGLIEVLKDDQNLYPKYKNYHSSGDYFCHGHSWTEVHLCLHCNKEFELENSDY